MDLVCGRHFGYWEPILIGEVLKDPSVRILYNEEMVPIDTGHIRNLFVELHGDVEEYIKRLLELDMILRGGNLHQKLKRCLYC